MFTGEVKIEAKSGAVMIQDVLPGEILKLGEQEQELTDWEYAGLGELVEIVLENKNRFKCTKSQKLLVLDGEQEVWLPAGEIKKHTLRSSNGGSIKVINRKSADIDDVYELQTETGTVALSAGVLALCEKAKG